MLSVGTKAVRGTNDKRGSNLVFVRFEPFHIEEIHCKAKHITFESNGDILSPLTLPFESHFYFLCAVVCYSALTLLVILFKSFTLRYVDNVN